MRYPLFAVCNGISDPDMSITSLVHRWWRLPDNGCPNIFQLIRESISMQDVATCGASFYHNALILVSTERDRVSSLLRLYNRGIQGVTGPHRQNDRDDRPCREDHFLWRNMCSQICRLWVMRRWRCSPLRVGIEYRQLYTYHFIEKGMFLQYVFKQSALCLIACLISSQQRSANKA